MSYLPLSLHLKVKGWGSVGAVQKGSDISWLHVVSRVESVCDPRGSVTTIFYDTRQFITLDDAYYYRMARILIWFVL